MKNEEILLSNSAKPTIRQRKEENIDSNLLVDPNFLAFAFSMGFLGTGKFAPRFFFPSIYMVTCGKGPQKYHVAEEGKHYCVTFTQTKFWKVQNQQNNLSFVFDFQKQTKRSLILLTLKASTTHRIFKKLII